MEGKREKVLIVSTILLLSMLASAAVSFKPPTACFRNTSPSHNARTHHTQVLRNNEVIFGPKAAFFHLLLIGTALMGLCGAREHMWPCNEMYPKTRLLNLQGGYFWSLPACAPRLTTACFRIFNRLRRLAVGWNLLRFGPGPGKEGCGSGESAAHRHTTIDILSHHHRPLPVIADGGPLLCRVPREVRGLGLGQTQGWARTLPGPLHQLPVHTLPNIAPYRCN